MSGVRISRQALVRSAVAAGALAISAVAAQAGGLAVREQSTSSQGASFANIVEFTTYLVHSQDIPKFMAYRTREFPKLFAGGAYPPNTLLMIDRLVREEFLIEVSAVAAL